jgi:two-component system nitrate/nitrite response regulator NarL
MMSIRLVLADDHPIVLDGLAQLFAMERDFDVVALATTGEEALQAARQLLPDILVLDLRMPGTDGFAVLRQLKREQLPTRTVVLTALDAGQGLEALRLGARGIAMKDMAPRLLVQCVRAVHAGKQWVEKGVATQAVETLLKREAGIRVMAEVLTPREIEVARMIASGRSSKVVANALAISEGTAKLHLHHVYEKLNLDGRVALMRYMQSQGFD